MGATARFFKDLDRQLPDERGPNGEPSTKDFQVLDLLRIRFATRWDDLPQLIPGRPEYRIPLATGNVVARFASISQLAPDGAIGLLELDLANNAGW